ncbi:helix-turn-helix domain-containing protein [Pseudonocardia cypriaca]|uniref:Helix-turn-helix protein n=1 Tax=Pseudonocardia cypriaca TaxID=882449 RepID=A0A543FVR5_9PSEU|nr:helix-turn-helix transcriptional regulator [Pseudonocardia cypriaca]TQM37940.1 helix-turn-helix protein [Pseudonocardia cypriaca]
MEPTPPTARRELGNLLRELRLGRELGLEAVARRVDLTPGFLSRVERGLRGIGDDKAERLSEFYGLPPRVRERVRQLAPITRAKTWWETAPMARPTREYIGFEQAATAIMSYGSIVHGLLQTQAYCEAMVGGTSITTPAEHTAATVERRLRRQEVLGRPEPPWVWIILDESALHRTIGDPPTMRDQLLALLAATDRARVSVRIIPFSAGAHAGLDSRFTMVSTRNDHAPELVYVEGLSGARTLFEAHDLARYAEAWQALAALALPDKDSRNLIGRTAHDTTTPM